MDQLDELSIAQAIVDVAVRHAHRRRIVGIEVRLGRQCDVVPESLQFAFALLTPGTALDGAKLAIDVTGGSELVLDAMELEEEPATSWLDRGSHV